MFRVLLLLAAACCGAAQSLPAPASALTGKALRAMQVTDLAGNIYVAAMTNRPGLPVSSDAVQSAYAGGSCYVISFGQLIGPNSFPCYDLYVAKLDPTGTTILAATYLGGAQNESASTLALDALGNVYLWGASDSLTFLPLTGPPAMGASNFVAKLSPNLDKVLYGVALPAARMALDPENNVWTVGTLPGSNPTPVLAEIDPSGSIALLKPISDIDTVSAIALDSAGNPVAVGTRKPTAQHRGQVGVVRFRASGERISASIFGNADYFPGAAAIAPSGTVYVVGQITGSGTETDPPGGFFASVAMDGSAHRLAIGQTLSDVVVGNDNRAYAVGNASAGVPTTPDAIQRCRAGSDLNVFVAGWDGLSPAPFYATYAGPRDSFPGLVKLDPSGVLTLFGPVLSSSANRFTRIQPGSGAGQPACVDPLPANLANARLFAAMDPARIPPAVAAGEYVVFYGSGIGPDTPVQWDPSGSVPPKLGGVQLLVGGTPAPLLSVSANQLIAIMPLELADTGAASLEIDRDGVAVASAQVPLTAAAPALFGASSTGFVSPAVFNQDFSLNSAANPAGPGDVIAVFVSGGGALRPRMPDGSIVPPAALPLSAVPITAFIEGSGKQVVTFAGQAANAAAGLMQVNVRIGYDFTFHGQMTLTIMFASQGVNATFWVR